MNFPNYDANESKTLVAPSILSADFAHLARDVDMISAACDLLHIDVMDGHFVPNLSFGFPVLNAIKEQKKVPFDVHLMMTNPDQYIEDFAKAGADLLTVHVEACTHLHRVVQQIRAHGMHAGVSLNPATPLASLDEILPYVDLVLIMSVNPGFGGQSYIPTMTEKIRRLRHMLNERKLNVHIEVDGGVSPETAPAIVAAGANILVAGSAVFNAKDPISVIKELQACKA